MKWITYAEDANGGMELQVPEQYKTANDKNKELAKSGKILVEEGFNGHTSLQAKPKPINKKKLPEGTAKLFLMQYQISDIVKDINNLKYSIEQHILEDKFKATTMPTLIGKIKELLTMPLW